MVVNKWIIIRFIALCVVTVTLDFFRVSFVSANDTSEEAATLVDAVFANIVSVKNYDVRIEHEFWIVPSDENQASKCDPLNELKTSRIIHDLTDNRCFRMSQKKNERMPDQGAALPYSHAVRYGFYEPETYTRNVLNKGSPAKPFTQKSVSFEDFCKQESFEFPLLLSTSFPRIARYFDMKEYAASYSNSHRVKNASLEILPDGIQRVTRENVSESGARLRSVSTIDSENFRYLGRSTAQFKDGKWSTVTSGTISYDSVENPNLPTRISYSKPAVLTDKTKTAPPGIVQANEVGTIVMTWIAVNAKVLEFPKLEDFDPSNESKWNEYLHPKELRKVESNDIRK